MRRTELAGARVFVVGGSQGIGLAAARRMTALGADVTLFARRQTILEEAATSLTTLRRHQRQRIAWHVLDVRDADAVTATLHALVADGGPPDLLLNCAGRAYPRRFEEVSSAQLVDTIATNFYGCWHTTAAVVPAMKARRRGYIVNTASLAGLIGIFGYTDHSASKFAVVGFTEALRSELAPHGITVSVLCPPTPTRRASPSRTPRSRSRRRPSRPAPKCSAPTSSWRHSWMAWHAGRPSSSPGAKDG